jgi:hypothetical protein
MDGLERIFQEKCEATGTIEYIYASVHFSSILCYHIGAKDVCRQKHVETIGADQGIRYHQEKILVITCVVEFSDTQNHLNDTSPQIHSMS